VGSVVGVAPGVRVGCALFSMEADIKMLIVFTVSVSGGCDCLPEVLLGFVVGFVMVRVSSHLANWVLSSSNCARRIHSCTRVASYLSLFHVCWGDCLLLRFL